MIIACVLKYQYVHRRIRVHNVQQLVLGCSNQAGAPFASMD